MTAWPGDTTPCSRSARHLKARALPAYGGQELEHARKFGRLEYGVNVGKPASVVSAYVIVTLGMPSTVLMVVLAVVQPGVSGAPPCP